CTVMLRVHEPLAGITAPAGRPTELSAVMLAAELLLARHVVLALVATRPAGRLSVSGAVSVASVEDGLVKVMTAVLSWVRCTVEGVNALLTVGESITVRVASASSGLSPWSVCRAPAGIVLT